jgi:hypothetical protein
MEYTMNDDPVEFFVERDFKFESVFFNPIHTDIDITANKACALRGVECYNVCVGFVIKVLDVDFAEILVRTKYEVQIPGGSPFLKNSFPDPGGCFTGMG